MAESMSDLFDTTKTELQLRYRPTTYDEVVGQPDAIKVLKGFGNAIKHCLLFYGPPGTGKTTLARITSERVGCKIDNQFDYREINCGSVNPIDCIREIQANVGQTPFGGAARVYVFDEIQSFSRAKFAQEAMLKLLEDSIGHAYFFLCTTDPTKIIKAIRSRCSDIKLKEVKDDDIESLINRVLKAEKASMSQRVISKIVDVAAGSPRNALVALDKVIGLTDEADQLASVSPFGEMPEAFDLVKALMPWKDGPSWATVATILTTLKEANADPEGLRQMILASARSHLVNPKANQMHAYKVIKCLMDPLYDRNSGHAILAAMCFQAVNGKG